MKKLLALAIIAFAMVGCTRPADNVAPEAGTNSVYFWHDDARHVCCWIYAQGYKGGISCLPDGQYKP